MRQSNADRKFVVLHKAVYSQGDVNDTYTEPDTDEDTDSSINDFFAFFIKLRDTLLKVLNVMKNFLVVLLKK